MATPEKTPESVILTLTLPPTTGLRKLGTIVGRQGTAAVMIEFEYTDLSGILSAIQQTSAQLNARKSALANAIAAQKAAAAANTAPASPAAGDDPDSDVDDADDPTTEDDDGEPTAAPDDTLSTLEASAPVATHDPLDVTTVPAKRDGQLSLI